MSVILSGGLALYTFIFSIAVLLQSRAKSNPSLASAGFGTILSLLLRACGAFDANNQAFAILDLQVNAVDTILSMLSVQLI